MFHKLLKNKKFILATILIAGLFLIFSTKSANACNVFTNGTACIEEFVTYIIQTITYAIFFVLGKAINLISQFLFPVVYLGNQAIGSPLVRTGFKICLQIANLGFVVSIIYVAFATITKFNDYKIKDFLIKLITAAVLINFSFAMAGTVMDISNVIGNYFLSKSIPGDGNLEGFSTQMANAFNLGKLNAVKEGPNEGFTDNLSSLGRSFLNLIFSMGLSIFISIIVLLTFIGIVGMMLARYVWMVILITCMPIIWLCYMSPFPEIKGYFNKWWKMFLKWIYFYPVTAFFLYLALLTATSVTNGASSAVYSQGSAQELNKTILNESGLTGLIDAILKAAMFMAALYLGSQAGGGFMKTTMSWANGAKNKFVGTYRAMGGAPIKGVKYVGQGARRYGTSLLRTEGNLFGKKIPFIGGKQNIEAMKSLGGDIKGFKGALYRGLLNATGIRPAARVVGNALEAASSGKNIKAEAEARLKDRSHDDLARNFPTLTDIEKMVAIERAKKDDKLDKYDMVDYLAKANKNTWEKFGSTKDLEAIEKKTGINQEMAKALQNKDDETYKKAMTAFYSKFKEGDVKTLSDDASRQEFDETGKSKLHKALGKDNFNALRDGISDVLLKKFPSAYIGRVIKDLPNLKAVDAFKVRLITTSSLRSEIGGIGSDKAKVDKITDLLQSAGLITSFNNDVELDTANNQFKLKKPITKEELIKKYENESDPVKKSEINKVIMHFLESDDANVSKALNSGINKRLTGFVDDSGTTTQNP